MSAPVETSAPRRSPWWLVAGLIVVAAGVGFGAGALVWAGGAEDPGSPPSPYSSGFPVLSPKQYDTCVRQVIVNFSGDDPDAAMRSAAARLDDDDRFESVRARTRQETYEEFVKVFADQPDLLENVAPESLPASVLALVRKGSTAKEVERSIAGEFPDDDVTVQPTCPRPPR